MMRCMPCIALRALCVWLPAKQGLVLPAGQVYTGPCSALILPNVFHMQPLPEDSLALLKKLKLHKPNKEQGWNALHYACAGHRYGEPGCLLNQAYCYSCNERPR